MYWVYICCHKIYEGAKICIISLNEIAFSEHVFIDNLKTIKAYSFQNTSICRKFFALSDDISFKPQNSLFQFSIFTTYEHFRRLRGKYLEYHKINFIVIISKGFSIEWYINIQFIPKDLEKPRSNMKGTQN